MVLVFLQPFVWNRLGTIWISNIWLLHFFSSNILIEKIIVNVLKFMIFWCYFSLTLYLLLLILEVFIDVYLSYFSFNIIPHIPQYWSIYRCLFIIFFLNERKEKRLYCIYPTNPPFWYQSFYSYVSELLFNHIYYVFSNFYKYIINDHNYRIKNLSIYG